MKNKIKYINKDTSCQLVIGVILQASVHLARAFLLSVVCHYSAPPDLLYFIYHFWLQFCERLSNDLSSQKQISVFKIPKGKIYLAGFY